VLESSRLWRSVSNLIGSPASGEFRELVWASVIALSQVSNLIGSPASGE